MKNHGLRPTSSVPLSEANGKANTISRRRRGRGRGHGHGRVHGINHGRNNQQSYQQQGNKFKRHKANESNKSKKKHEESYFRCGMKGHWTRTCRISKHLVDLYQRSIKGKEKLETNFVDYDGPVDVTHLDVSDFFIDPNGNIDHLVGGGVIEDID